MEPELGEHYNLKWNSHHLETFRAFETHRVNESLVDVLLFCDGHVIKAHKLVLSACSAYFEKLFEITGSSTREPVLIFREAGIDILRLAVEFMYNGEVEVPSEKLTQFFQLSESLEIKGLRTREKEHHVVRNESPEGEQVEIHHQQALQPPTKKRRVLSASGGMKQRQRPAVPVKHVKPVVKQEFVPTVKSFPLSPDAVGQAVQTSDDAMDDKMAVKPQVLKSRVPLRSSDSDSGESERAPAGPEHADGSDDAEFGEDDEDHGGDSSFLSTPADLENMELDRPQYVPPDIVVEGPSPELHGLFRGRDQRGRLVYLCGFCQYTASKKTHGIDHVRIHTGDRPYACSICGRKFTRKQHMRKHEFLHRVKEESGGVVDIVDLGCDSPVESPENGKASEHDSGNEVDASEVHLGHGITVG